MFYELFFFCFLFGLSCSERDREFLRLSIEPAPELHQAARVGDLERMRRLLGEGFDINTPNPFGKTALHHAIFGDQAQSALFLIERGADVNARTSSNSAPLHDVNNVEMARILIEAGADIDARDNDNWTPLYAAVARERIPLARFLFKKGANPYIVNNYGETPLSLAKKKVSFFNCSWRRLIKDFESYTPPPDPKGGARPQNPKAPPAPNKNPGAAEGKKPKASSKSPKVLADNPNVPSFPREDFDISP